MTDVLQFALLGIGLGAIYALVALGVVLVYRGSGVVNFAHGTFALAGAVVYTELRTNGWSTPLAIASAVLAGAAIGLATAHLIMRRLRDAAPIVRVVATLGLFIAMQAAAALHYKDRITTLPQFLPNEPLDVFGVTVATDRLILAGIAIALGIILWAIQRRWLVGLATRAASENEEAVATLGWSPNTLASVNWAIGGALAGLAGALLVPLTGLVVANISLLIVPALAAALLGGFNSFTLTLVGALGIGMAQSLITRYGSEPGLSEAVPFLAIILILILTGRSLPLRSHLTDRLPSVGRGLVRARLVIPLVIASVLLMAFVFNTQWQDAFTVTLAEAVVLLSLVVVTGYAGQISLAQMALAGLGAFVAGRLVAAEGWPYWAAFLAGVAAAVPIGVVFALPALRTRGITLAVVTLGMGVAISAMLFNNVHYTGGLQGTDVGDTNLFGYDINALDHPDRYGVFVLLVFTGAALIVANLRRSAWGRRLIAIRENERAAASLGLSITNAKLFAFAVGGMLAAVGGILLGFRNPAIVYTSFDPFSSILAIVYAVIGGLGYVMGPVLGATLVTAGVGSLLNGVLSDISSYLGLIGGVVVIIVLLLNPDGLVPAQMAQGQAIWRWLKPKIPGAERRAKASADAPASADTRGGVRLPTVAPERERVAAKPLHARGLTVRFGGVVAVDGVDFEVAPGEIVGLIGANGAGKTTLIDAITGFAPIAAGSVSIGDVDMTRASAHRRARSGIVRSWQSLEIFEQMTVAENLLVASEAVRLGPAAAVTSLIYPPRRLELSPAAAAAVMEFGLADDLARRPEDLSYGRRRLVGIARSVALSPSVLLLDEPAAGLTEHESNELGVLITSLARSWGMGIVLVEHYTDLVMAVCDRIVVLDFGKKIADGSPAEVRRDPAVVAAHLGPSGAGVVA